MTRISARAARYLALTSVAIACTTSAGAQDRVAAAKIGERAPEISLKDIRNAARGLGDFGEPRAFVIVFLDASCAAVGETLPRLESLWRETRSRGGIVIGVNSNAREGVVELGAHALENGLSFPMHKDFDQSVKAAFGVTRTPQAVVLDERRVLRYRGAVIEPATKEGEAAKEPLRDACLAVLDGKAPPRAEVAAAGCLIRRPRQSRGRGITFSEHVAPILQRHCQSCHRPHRTAPFSLLTFADASANSARIDDAVHEGRMPPSFNDPRYGKFVNHQRLSRKEKEILRGWVSAGAPEGDPSRLPPPIVWPRGVWGIDKPDLVIAMKDEFRVSASGYIDYHYADLDYEFRHDTWVNQIEVLPGNRRVVHHANLYVRLPKRLGGGETLVTGFVPGGDVTRYGKNAGILIPAGSSMRLQIHYTTVGSEQVDRTRVGFVWAKDTIRRRVRCLQLINNRFEIPPMDPFYEVRKEATLKKAAIGEALFVHMHLRGRDMTFFAHYPDGRKETLLSVPCFSFDWQMGYRWKTGTKRFPAGTRIVTVSHYDNSPFNPFNPDPSKTVREGRQSYHEMNYGFLFWFEEGEDLRLAVDPKTGRVTGRAPAE
jgi:predicted CXXCH cytochrome family protein